MAINCRRHCLCTRHAFLRRARDCWIKKNLVVAEEPQVDIKRHDLGADVTSQVSPAVLLPEKGGDIDDDSGGCGVPGPHEEARPEERAGPLRVQIDAGDVVPHAVLVVRTVAAAKSIGGGHRQRPYRRRIPSLLQDTGMKIESLRDQRAIWVEVCTLLLQDGARRLRSLLRG